MPAETHQLGRDEDTACLADLWAAVRKEFGERGLGSEIDPDVLDPDMTVETAAAAMVRLLVGGDDGC